MVVNTITEAKAHLSSLVDRAAEGEEIIISKAGKAVAVLLPYNRATGVR
jgi:prevent-host-death family protein